MNGPRGAAEMIKWVRTLCLLMANTPEGRVWGRLNSATFPFFSPQNVALVLMILVRVFILFLYMLVSVHSLGFVFKPYISGTCFVHVLGFFYQPGVGGVTHTDAGSSSISVFSAA